MTETVAFVGAVGGAGTTTAVVETAAALARDGSRVRVLDTAYATQGLARHVAGRIDSDATAVCVSDTSLADASYELDLAVSGEVVVTPADAPFERLVRAKTVEAAQAFESVCATAQTDADWVLLDVPPVAANQHVAAVETADRIVVVTPGDSRGADALRQTRDRLADLDCTVDVVLSTRGEILPAEATLPQEPRTAGEVPVALGDDQAAATVVSAAETVLGTEFAVEIDTDGVLDQLRSRFTSSDDSRGETDGDEDPFDGTLGDTGEERASGDSDGERASGDSDGERASSDSERDDSE